jgi:hypothetical protein
MKSKQLCLIVVFTITVALFFFPLSSFSFQNEPDAFRGIKWESSVKGLRGMKLVENDHKDTKFYIRKVDKLIIGKAGLKSIAYGFYKDRFYFVYIRFNSDTNFSSIKEALFEQYGPGIQSDKSKEEYIWAGKDVNISLQYNEVSQRGKVYYFFKPISEEEERDKKEKPAEATGKL